MENFDFNGELLAAQSDLLYFAYKLTADREKARDLLQETLLKALANKDKYNSDVNFKGWLFVIMRNTFINDCRMEMNHPCISYSTYCMQCRDEPWQAGADADHDAKEIQKALQKIPKEHYIPFKMYVDGFKYREIAEEMGLTLGTVKSRIFYCRKKLKTLLNDFV